MNGVALVPERLQLLQSFLDSVDAETGSDDLQDVRVARRWLGDHGVGRAPDLDAASLARGRELRDLLRAVLAHHRDRTTPIEAARLSELAGWLPVRVGFDPDGTAGCRAGGQGWAGFLARIVADVAAATATGDWARLKICAEGTCAVVYFDESKNCSRRWCSMQVCGNRQKTRAYYRRTAASSRPAHASSS